MNKFEILQKCHVSPELKKQVEGIVLECILTARKKYGEDKIKVIPEIQFKTKGRVAGFCGYDHFTGKHWININPILLNENQEEMLNQTVPHEMAHCVVHQLYSHVNQWNKPSPHGREWQSVMWVFGLDPDRCHKMDVTTISAIRNNGIVFQYKCLCGKHSLSQRIHTKIQRGATYTCKRCKSKLVLDSISAV